MGRGHWNMEKNKEKMQNRKFQCPPLIAAFVGKNWTTFSRYGEKQRRLTLETSASEGIAIANQLRFY